jgi:hypothetical protein
VRQRADAALDRCARRELVRPPAPVRAHELVQDCRLRRVRPAGAGATTINTESPRAWRDDASPRAHLARDGGVGYGGVGYEPSTDGTAPETGGSCVRGELAASILLTGSAGRPSALRACRCRMPRLSRKSLASSLLIAPTSTIRAACTSSACTTSAVSIYAGNPYGALGTRTSACIRASSATFSLETTIAAR